MGNSIFCMVGLLFTLLWSSGCGDPEDVHLGDEEVCDNSIDDDGDEAVDCDDDDCADDPDCGAPVEDCDNGGDDDGDGLADCDDPDCDADPACGGPVEDCDNGGDDDGDGAVDCDDDDCDGDPACGDPLEDCGNGVDDDGDGLADCDDVDCETDPACARIEVCDNRVDDDADELVDCGDPDCDDDSSCLEDCANGVDDDGDGLTDCLDPSCDFELDCAEYCNGEDDDGDGLIDELPRDPGMGTPCYDGTPELAGVGQCEEGTIECFGGEILCVGWVRPLEMELCDGLDNDCDGAPTDDEILAGCRSLIIPGELSRIEFQTAIRDVDVHVNLDTTGSMGGALDTLRNTLSTNIVPGIREILPTSEFGVSTFNDFPVGEFGDPGDVPFLLHQRVTSNVPIVQEALDRVSLHSGRDNPESGLESLHQIATGDGATWPGEPWIAEVCDNWRHDDGDGLLDCDDPDCVAHESCSVSSWPTEVCSGSVDEDFDGYNDCDDPDCAGFWSCDVAGQCPSPLEVGLRTMTVGHIAPGDVDAYTVSVPAGTAFEVDIDASQAGSTLDAYLSLFNQADLFELAANDDFCGLDSRISWVPGVAMNVVIEVRGLAPTSEGWYAMHVSLDGVEHVGAGDSCIELEVGGSSVASGLFDPAQAVPLVEASTAFPRAASGTCLIDCGRELDAAEADPWIGSFCGGPHSISTCGDGMLDPLEECDDGDTTSGDGCDWACRVEVPPPTCGDGARDPGEECDDGNLTSGDGCSVGCAIEPGCGNGLREDDECDDGNLTSGDGCSAACLIEFVCGDGYRVAGEQCDDGGLTPGDGCDATCMVEPECGNGVLDVGEQCDDGGLVIGDGCDDGCVMESSPGIPGFDWTDGFDPGLGHGTFGGVGFRDTALPVIVHISDAPSHDCADYTAFDPEIDAACSADTFYELGAIGARVVGVSTNPGTDPTDLTMPLGMVTVTGSVVPLCAFDATAARLDGRCGGDECCTGMGGQGVAPDVDGDCPLVFQIGWDGAGLDTGIINALDTLTQFVRYELTSSPRDDPTDGVNALCFVESIRVVAYDGPPGTCVVSPTPIDTDGDGINDTLGNSTPRTRVTFEVMGVNADIHDVDGDGDTTEPCGESGSYGLYLDVVAEGGTVVASRHVVVEVD